MIMDMIKEFFADLITGMMDYIISWVAKFIIAETDLTMLPQLDIITWSAQSVGVVLTGVFVTKRAFNMITGEEDDWVHIITSGLKSILMIAAMPFILKWFIELNNLGIQLVAVIGFEAGESGKQGVQTLLDKLLNVVAPGGLLKAGFIALLMLLVLIVGTFCLALNGAVRLVQIFGLHLVGPIVASTQTDQRQILQGFWVETISIIFTQIWLFLVFWLTFQFAMMGNWFGICLAIASVWTGVTGRAFLKQFLYKSGVATGTAGVGRLVVLKMFTKNFR